MIDIIDRLRDKNSQLTGSDYWNEIYNQRKDAANEIERLRNLTVREVDFPALDSILTEKLLDGSYIKFQSEKWILFGKDGCGIASGVTISKMLENLIWAEG